MAPSPVVALSVHVALLATSIFLSSVAGLWLIPSVLDEIYISRVLLVTLLATRVFVDVVVYIVSIILYGKAIDTKHMLTAHYSFYYLTSITLGIAELVMVGYFMRQTSDISTLDSTTFTHPTEFIAVIVYRSVIVVSMNFWAVRIATFFIAFLQTIKDLVYYSSINNNTAPSTHRYRKRT